MIGERPLQACPECGRRNKARHYLGSAELYWCCSGCWRSYGGQEGAAKDALIADAAEGDPGELGEVEGRGR